jgi:hypothetical protein
MFTRIPVKQEQFLWLVVDGLPASRAYAEVYGQDKSKAVCEAAASRLLTNVKVVSRRQELIAAKAQRQPITVEYLSRELLAVAGESRSLGQGSAAAQAYMGVAKLHGLLVDRVQADVLVRKPSSSPESPDDLSAEEWLNQYASSKLIEHDELNTVEPTTEGSTDAGST